MKKIAFVVQRYGSEVNGGAEYHCRLLAEHLNDVFDIEILTSCATDYMTWANAYPEGLSVINGVKVRRFRTLQERNKTKISRLERTLKKRRWYQKLLLFFGVLENFEAIFKLDTDLEKLNYEWSKHQGPFVPDLIQYIKDNENHFDAFVFFTYLYFPTLYGLRVAPDKSILIPTAHDEPPLYLPAFRSLFGLPKAILFNTRSEQRLINRLFKNSTVYNDIVGIGIDNSENKSSDLQKSPIVGEYIVYIGRIDQSKGCRLLIDYFIQYKRMSKNNLKLILVGHAFMDIPSNSDIVHLGFVDESVKLSVLVGSKALVIPSLYESLSLVTLESMAAGIPVIANEYCEVLKDHITESEAGFVFSDYKSFELVIETLLSEDLDLETLKLNGYNYVKRNYNWKVVIEKISKAVEFVTSR